MSSFYLQSLRSSRVKHFKNFPLDEKQRLVVSRGQPEGNYGRGHSMQEDSIKVYLRSSILSLVQYYYQSLVHVYTW